MREPLDVFITVDVEHGGLSHALANPGERLEPATLDCLTDEGPAGLPFIVDALAAHGLKATFFIEPLARHRFGDAPMAAAVQSLLARGMDAQLHAHPAWLFFKDGKSRPDTLCGLAAAEQESILREAAALLAAWGAKPRAFRAGGFRADNTTYAALAALGLPFSSSYNLASLGGDCRIDLPGPRNDAFRVAGLSEIPLTTYQVRDPRRALRHARKHFQVASTPLARARELLASAEAAGVRCVTLLLHNFEFVRRSGGDWFQGPFRAHRGLMENFRALCAYLGGSRDRFRVRTFGDLEEGYAGRGEPGEGFLPKLSGFYWPQ